MGAAHAAILQKANDVHRLMETSNESGASLAEYNGFQTRHGGFMTSAGIGASALRIAQRRAGPCQSDFHSTSFLSLGLLGLLFSLWHHAGHPRLPATDRSAGVKLVGKSGVA